MGFDDNYECPDDMHLKGDTSVDVWELVHSEEEEVAADMALLTQHILATRQVTELIVHLSNNSNHYSVPRRLAPWCQGSKPSSSLISRVFRPNGGR